MNIYINSKLQEIPEKATIMEALRSSGITAFSGIAVAVNNAIIPFSSWSSHTLDPEDNLVIIRATQGG